MGLDFIVFSGPSPAWWPVGTSIWDPLFQWLLVCLFVFQAVYVLKGRGD